MEDVLGFAFPCCCKPKVNCLIISDSFDRLNNTNIGVLWQEVSGSNPAIATNTLSSTGSYLVATTMQAPSESMSVKVTILPPASILVEITRVIVNYLDSSNYLFVQFETSNSFGTQKTEMKFFRRFGGVNSQLGTTKVIDATNAMTMIEAIVCYDGTYLKSMGFTQIADKIVDGKKAGLEYVGSLTCRFDNFFWYRWDPLDNCPVCANALVNCTQVCENGLRPSCIWVLDFAAGGWTNNSCNTCTNVTGEYVLTCVEATGGGGCFSNAIACLWWYTSPACGDSGVFARNICMQGGIARLIGSSNYRFSVTGIIRRISFGGQQGESSRFTYGVNSPISSGCNISSLTLSKELELHTGSPPGNTNAPCAGTLPATIALRQVF